MSYEEGSMDVFECLELLLECVLYMNGVRYDDPLYHQVMDAVKYVREGVKKGRLKLL